MPSVTMKIGQTVPVTANITDGYGVPAPADIITWVSSDFTVAIVSNNSFIPGTDNTISTNTISAISNGSAVITCTVNGVIMATANVTVSTPAPASIGLVLGQPVP